MSIELNTDAISQQQENVRWEQRIRVLSPAPCSDVKGRVKVQMEAMNLTFKRDGLL